MQLSNSNKNAETTVEAPPSVDEINRDETPLPEINTLNIDGDGDAAVDDDSASDSDTSVSGVYIIKVKVPRGAKGHGKGKHPHGHHHRRCRGHSPPNWAEMKGVFPHPHGLPHHPPMFDGWGRGGRGGRGGHAHHRGPGRHGGSFGPDFTFGHGPAPPPPPPCPFHHGPPFNEYFGARPRPPPTQSSSDSESDSDCVPPPPRHHRGKHHRGHRGPSDWSLPCEHPSAPPMFDGRSPFHGPAGEPGPSSRYGPPPLWFGMDFDMPPHGGHGGRGRGRGGFGRHGGRDGFHFGPHATGPFGDDVETAA